MTVAPTSPGHAAFTVRALRSLSGRVTSYDTKASKYIPVAKAQVTLRERGLTVQTDAQGRFLFRDLAAGAYTISVQGGAKPAIGAVRLGALPLDLTNVDFQTASPVRNDAVQNRVSAPPIRVSGAAPPVARAPIRGKVVAGTHRPAGKPGPATKKKPRKRPRPQ